MGKEDLEKLYNTLCMIETKGENTKIMAQCLQFIEQKVQEVDLQDAPNKDVESVPA